MSRNHPSLNSRILSSLATVLADTRSKTTANDIDNLLKRCPSVPFDRLPDDGSIAKPNQGDSVYNMTRRGHAALAALARYVVNVSEDNMTDMVSRLLAYMRFLPAYEWEESRLERVTHTLAYSLLAICERQPDMYDRITHVLWEYGRHLIRLLELQDDKYTVVFILPSLAGLSRALQTSPFLYKPYQLVHLYTYTQPLLKEHSLENIRCAISRCLNEHPATSYSRHILDRYWQSGMPLSGNRIVYDFLSTIRNVSIGVLGNINPRNVPDNWVCPESPEDQKMAIKRPLECLRSTLLQQPTERIDHSLSDSVEKNILLNKNLRAIYVMSLGYYKDLREFAEKIVQDGKKWSIDIYMTEILSASLHVAAISSAYLHQEDDVLKECLSSCLFSPVQVEDSRVHMAALDSVTLLAVNFPYLYTSMANIISRFLATPSPVFSAKPELNKEAQSVQQFSIIRLGQCIQAQPASQRHLLAASILYALLNEITRYTNEDGSAEGTNGTFSRTNTIYGVPRADQLSEPQKQQVCENVLAAIVGIAVHMKDSKIVMQAYSMLAPRRKLLSNPLNLLFVKKLVELALVSPRNVFEDIIHLISTLSFEAFNSNDGILATTILEAQSDLAQKISSVPEFYDLYLINLLTLFVTIGNEIQRKGNSINREKGTPLTSSLGRLLPVLATLLNHKDFHSPLMATEEVILLFRNFWFLCVIFGFVVNRTWTRKWNESLHIIAFKTPILAIQSTTEQLESDIAFNSVLRGSNEEALLLPMREQLAGLFPTYAYEIKYYSFACAVFSLSVYHVEIMRSRMGDCSFILRYFMNTGVDRSAVSNCLELIATRVGDEYIEKSVESSASQDLDNDLSEQVKTLLKFCCHRLKRVHILAVQLTDKISKQFPQIFSEKPVITLLLELLHLLWLSCESEYREEYTPTFHFISKRVNVTIELGDSYTYRHSISTHLYVSAKAWIESAIEWAPFETNGSLQCYLAEFDKSDLYSLYEEAHVGRSLAVELAKSAIESQNGTVFAFMPHIPSMSLDNTSDFIYRLTARMYFIGEISGIKYISSFNEVKDKPLHKIRDTPIEDLVSFVLETLDDLTKSVKEKKPVSPENLRTLLFQAGGFVISMDTVHPLLVSHLVRIPIYMFTPESLVIGTDVWNWVLTERPEVEHRLMMNIKSMWTWAMQFRKGMFSPVLNLTHPFNRKMTYTPSVKTIAIKNVQIANSMFLPHITWIRFLKSWFHATRHRSKHLITMFVWLLRSSFRNADLMSNHPLARRVRFEFLTLGMDVLQSIKLETLEEYTLRSLVYDAAFNWFSNSPRWNYGSQKLLALHELKVLSTFSKTVMNDMTKLDLHFTSFAKNKCSYEACAKTHILFNGLNKEDILRRHVKVKKLLLLFVDSEIFRLSVWSNPLNAVGVGNLPAYVGNTERLLTTEDMWKDMVRFAWCVSPRAAVQMASRFFAPIVHRELYSLISNKALDVVDVPEAAVILLGQKLGPDSKSILKYLKYWAPVPPITATSYFLPAYLSNPLLLQYAMRSLEYYPVDTVFFYIPQIVQALRYDVLGYVEKYIMEAGNVSQLFAHQLIWNMKANFYIDADKECVKPDSLKPTLEKVIKNLINCFTGNDREFFEREFKFFGEVTAISGYLKEYIKYGQNEKKPMQKKRLDEELSKIHVDVGVYLPSNPDGHVVDINRTSGRPLQSHAKAPFMATFLIERKIDDADPIMNGFELTKDDIDAASQKDATTKVWQAAIFKVGDDCRQDVLALQLIAVFKNIFMTVGLDLYVYPYRVVATAPGCGVIDVIPNSISRDQLGREKVNSLYDYFVAKYGGPDTIGFQKARTNFVQSVAAYSVILYILQIKDRHNGNIMLDDDGHMVHIDFGFIFDIAPGGIGFESSPFKLTAEMIQVMGGGSQEQAFKQFSELIVKAYLACRPYAELIMQLVSLMLDSSLPCFKGETIKRMRMRFQVDKSERAAADFMILRIGESFENRRTVLYDYFQKLTNGIPY
ncbi:hypothetical protein CLU79DRAFT_815895 [Phycomyces nitens]|nr:hypothetical protein CLU79DRAFT_815895 [Phycomyces nitens]